MGNSAKLKATALVEAFNLRAAIELAMGNPAGGRPMGGGCRGHSHSDDEELHAACCGSRLEVGVDSSVSSLQSRDGINHEQPSQLIHPACYPFPLQARRRR